MRPDGYITDPAHPGLAALCRQLAESGPPPDDTRAWPGRQLQACADHGVIAWFVPRSWGGQEWCEADIVRGYLQLSAACLTTTFILTQLAGACRRIAMAQQSVWPARLLPELVAGRSFATVGISHLSTSRRHLARPVLRAEQIPGGFRLDGFSPWVTGAPHAEVIVIGATLVDGRQILVGVPTDAAGVEVAPPQTLVGLSASQTGEVRLQGVQAAQEWLLAGPTENVLQQGSGAGTGGLQTSTLALGLAHAALEFLAQEGGARPDLVDPWREMRAEHQGLCDDLLALAQGREVCTTDNLRVRANSLVLRATQAALAAAKGAGYVAGHPAGRWCREALFFLVWSCPQAVVSAHLCELAGISD
jgi:alkylation response protein AidB-like acyl-CoA dehydrogenase